MKHVKLYVTDEHLVKMKSINVINYYTERYRAKCLFYKHYSFLDLVSIIMIEELAYELIIRNHYIHLRKLHKKNHKNITKVLNAIAKFESDMTTKLRLFQMFDVNYLEFIHAQKDRELYLYHIEQYVNEI